MSNDPTANSNYDLHGLLTSAGSSHRKIVAQNLGISDDSPEAIATALTDVERLTAVVSEVSPKARDMLFAIVFTPSHRLLPRFANPDSRENKELEERGLLFFFEHYGWGDFFVPDDLRRVLLRALVKVHLDVKTLRLKADDFSLEHFTSASLQMLHDAAAISACLSNEPVRVKKDGSIYARAWPKLEGALPFVQGMEMFNYSRVHFALSLLRDGGFVRLRIEDRPGYEQQRELTVAGDLLSKLSDTESNLTSELVALAQSAVYPLAPVLLTVLEEIGDRALSLHELAQVFLGILDSSSAYVVDMLVDSELTLAGILPIWLAGVVEIAFDGEGSPVAARVAKVKENATFDSRPAVCQSNFEVVFLRLPTPKERLVVETYCDRVPGQEHVYRLTRESVRNGERSSIPRLMLEGILGELPQNVARSITDWVATIRPPIRLRSAVIVDAGDAETAEALLSSPLSALVTERLSERLLAVPARELKKVEAAIVANDYELEPGLDRVSGAWNDNLGMTSQAAAEWESRRSHFQEVPRGKLVSTISNSSRTPVSQHYRR